MKNDRRIRIIQMQPFFRRILGASKKLSDYAENIKPEDEAKIRLENNRKGTWRYWGGLRESDKDPQDYKKHPLHVDRKGIGGDHHILACRGSKRTRSPQDCACSDHQRTEDDHLDLAR